MKRNVTEGERTPVACENNRASADILRSKRFGTINNEEIGE